MTDTDWRRAEPVLSQALGLDRAERDRMLNSAFGSEAKLLGELLDLLGACDSATRRLGANLARVSSSRTTGNGASDGPFLAPGDACGRYRIVRILGEGGMGQVYLAEDTQLGTPAALKLVSSPLLDSPEARARLRLEAARAAQLRYHPHIATVLEFTELELKGRDVALLAMEYVSGEAASTLLAEGPIHWDRAVRWAVQVARAMEFAHDRGILHCDLKPANLQIEALLTGEHVKVVDFGISRAVFDLAPGHTMAGTPGYMAPERMTRGECGKQDDIYGLGVTLFELVTGRRPFPGRGADLLLQVIGAPVPRISAVVASVPHELDAILQRAMAKEPTDRYRSMVAFRRDLESLVPATRPGPRRPYAAGAVGAVAFITLSGFVNSQALEQGLGRATAFGAGTLPSWFFWGIRSLVAPSVVSALLLLGLVCAVSAVRIAVSVSGARAMFEPMLAQARSALARLSPLPTASLAQLLLLFQVAVLAALGWYFRPLLAGFMNFMLGAPESIDALRPSNIATHENFGYLVTLQLLTFGAAWYWLRRRQTHRGERDGVVFIAAGMAALALSAFLFTARFRILSHNDLQRVVHAENTCYLVEDRGATALVFCPLAYPRTMVVNAASLIRSDQVENIFTPLDPS